MIVMGQVAAPFGIQGWIKIRSFCESLDSLLDYPVWWVGKEGGWKECKVIEASVHGKFLVAKIEGCPDRNAAERLKGAQIAVPREMLPENEADEYYWSDLIGLKVVNLEGIEFGNIETILETGANDVLQVKGEVDRLIPFIGKYVIEVDLEKGVVKVDWGADY